MHTMIDIFVYLFENYADFPVHPEGDTLLRKLSAEGFDEMEINAALEWLGNLRAGQAASFSSRSIRIFTEQERDRLGADCLDFLCFLERADVVDAPLRELILERAMELGDNRVSLEYFKVVVLMVLWSREQDLDPLIVEELLADVAEPPILQ